MWMRVNVVVGRRRVRYWFPGVWVKLGSSTFCNSSDSSARVEESEATLWKHLHFITWLLLLLSACLCLWPFDLPSNATVSYKVKSRSYTLKTLCGQLCVLSRSLTTRNNFLTFWCFFFFPPLVSFPKFMVDLFLDHNHNAWSTNQQSCCYHGDVSAGKLCSWLPKWRKTRERKLHIINIIVFNRRAFRDIQSSRLFIFILNISLICVGCRFTFTGVLSQIGSNRQPFVDYFHFSPRSLQKICQPVVWADVQSDWAKCQIVAHVQYKVHSISAMVLSSTAVY